MKKTDIILIVIALIAAVGIWLFYSAGAEKGLTAVVTVDGEVRAELPLDDGNATIETEWGYNIVHTENGQAFVTEADCRDQICVDHKKIEKVGETIVCLPHKMVVEIVGDGEAVADVVVG
ncbi:NusG domain II-containing protein [Anaerotignum sp.]